MSLHQALPQHSSRDRLPCQDSSWRVSASLASLSPVTYDTRGSRVAPEPVLHHDSVERFHGEPRPGEARDIAPGGLLALEPHFLLLSPAAFRILAR